MIYIKFIREYSLMEKRRSSKPELEVRFLLLSYLKYKIYYFLPPWWNGRHARLRIVCLMGVRVQVPWEAKYLFFKIFSKF